MRGINEYIRILIDSIKCYYFAQASTQNLMDKTCTCFQFLAFNLNWTYETLQPWNYTLMNENPFFLHHTLSNLNRRILWQEYHLNFPTLFFFVTLNLYVNKWWSHDPMPPKILNLSSIKVNVNCVSKNT